MVCDLDNDEDEEEDKNPIYVSHFRPRVEAFSLAALLKHRTYMKVVRIFQRY